MATPATAALVTVPWSVPVPVWIATVTLIVESAPVVTVLPKASSTVTTGWVPKAEPAVAPAGCVVKTSCEAAAARDGEAGRVDGDRAGAGERAGGAQRLRAASVSMRRLVKVATPATAACVTVPWSVPVPVWIATVTLIVESAPVVTVLPKASSTVTTGCVPNAAPAVAPAGWVV